MRRPRALVGAAVVWLLAIAFSAPALDDYYVTQSGRVLCAVTPDSTLGNDDGDWAVCQGAFTQATHGENCVSTSGNGSFRWASGDAAFDMPRTEMVYGRTYQWGIWSLLHNSTGTRVVNNRTGHGMFVSIDNVYAF